MAESSAPALTRGVRILQLLEDRRARLLEEIASETGYPKSSLTRLMETLVNLELIKRDPSTRKYTPCCILLPIQERAESIDNRLRPILGDLANRSSCTAEWYMPSENGMILIRRAEPADGEVSVIARIGYQRGWTGELEAVAAVGNAFFHDREDHSGFCSAGRHRPLSSAEAKAIIDSVRERGSVVDTEWNSNGVRRAAVIVKQRSIPVGVLAIAESMRPTPKLSPDEHLKLLKQASNQLIKQ